LAREARAQAYKLQLKDFKKAIALFYEISDPPRTLWEIQDCYLRWDRLNDACNTLKEIESMFPTQAARAAWTRTSYYHRQKIRPKTIAEARRILKIYPKTRESSQAHQLLERYGIATGGGVLEDG
jgi:tetratricopeptide (TPR) repeat protein